MKPQRHKSPASAETRTEAKAAVPLAELTPVQTMLADLAGDAIANGTTESVARRLIDALIEHSCSMRCGGTMPAETTHRIVEREQGEVYRQLAQSWPKRTQIEEHGSGAHANATEAVRSGARRRLSQYLNEFVRAASPEEVRILLEALEMWDPLAPGSTDSCPFAESMSSALDRAESAFLRVSRGREGTVRQFLATLDSAA